jgi:simple sugar transport system substrate-binding protein
MTKFGGNAHLAASVLNWGVVYKKVAAEVQAGTWKTGDLWWGVKDGAVNIEAFSANLPADVKKLAEERRDAIKAATLHPFTGPLKDQSGKEFLAAGKTYADADLKQMNFFVEGVEGNVPK